MEKLIILSLLMLALAVFLIKGIESQEHSHSHSHSHGESHGHEHLDPEEYEHEDHRHLYYKPQEENEIHHKHEHEHSHEHGHQHSPGHLHPDKHEGHEHLDDKRQEEDETHHEHEHGHSHEHEHGHSHEHGHDHSHGHLHPDEHEHEDHRHLYYKPTEAQHDHKHEDHGKKATESFRKVRDRFALSTWINALGATFLISAAPYLLLFLIPLDKNTEEQRPFLKVLLSFASGGLLGDAFLHLIPHAISPHSHGEDASSHSHSHGHSHSHSDAAGGHSHSHDGNMAVGLWVLAGIVAFLMVEKFVRYVKGGHSHSHSHVVPVKQDETSNEASTKKDDEGKQEDSETQEKSVHHNDQDAADIKVAGYLNLAADFTHNFTDGLAIGASFLVNRNLGLITTITILLHEVPHEIGDFAILIQSGCSKRKAMLLQLTTATGAMAGTVCGLLAEGSGSSTATLWILPFTAGGFIYIATVSVIPELLEDCKLWQSVKEIIALFTGVFMMVIIAKME